ncbi:hypothetical protein [Bacillus nakamurai]|nr:hypothetical protein [Bacillus nakamurai]
MKQAAITSHIRTFLPMGIKKGQALIFLGFSQIFICSLRILAV